MENVKKRDVKRFLRTVDAYTTTARRVSKTKTTSKIVAYNLYDLLQADLADMSRFWHANKGNCGEARGACEKEEIFVEGMR